MNETATATPETKKPIIKDARTLGWFKMNIFGLQHMFAMFGATVLVPILVETYFPGATFSVSTALLAAGLGTLGFHAITKFKVPAFLGSSFAFLGGFSTVANLDTGIYADMTYAEKLPYACGGIVVAGGLYIVLALIIRLVGVERVMHFLPPVVTGPTIICIGLSLAPSALGNISANWPLAIIAAGTVIYFYIWGKGMAKIIPILLGVIVSCIAAVIFQVIGLTNADGSEIINTAAIASEAWIGLPPLQMAKFDLTAILVMAPIAVATMMEHVGDMVAISATTGENYIEDPGLYRTLLGDGLMTACAGAGSAPANTTYGENTGVLELSGVHDPRVIRLAAVYAIILSFMPKFAGLIGAMPTAVIGGISVILYSMISGIGLRNIVENRVDLNNPRNLIIAGIILVIGTSGKVAVIPLGSTSITLTALALAAIFGIVANAVLPGNDYQFGVDQNADKNRGPWEH